MEAKLTDRVWGIEDLIALLPKPTVSVSQVEKEMLTAALAMKVKA